MIYADKSRLKQLLGRKIILELAESDMVLKVDRVEVMAAEVRRLKGNKHRYQILPNLRLLSLKVPVDVFVAPEFTAHGSVDRDHFHYVPGDVPEHLQIPSFVYTPRDDGPTGSAEAILERSPVVHFMVKYVSPGGG